MPVDLTISSCLPTANGALYICSGSQQTDPGDIVKIRDAIKENKEACLCLINYKKNGSAFNNQFYLVPLFSAGGQLVSHAADTIIYYYLLWWRNRIT